MKNILCKFVILALIASLSSCSQNLNKASVASSAESASSNAEGKLGESKFAAPIKIVHTASVAFRVSDTKAAALDIEKDVQRLGGLVSRHSHNSGLIRSQDFAFSADSALRVTAYTLSDSIVARIPVNHLSQFLVSISNMAVYVDNQIMNLDDKSLDYMANQQRSDFRRQIMASKGPGGTLFRSKSAAIDRNDEAIEESIANRAIDKDVKFATVSLAFYQNPALLRERIASDYFSTFTLPFSVRFHEAFSNGWSIFLTFVIFMVNIWVFLLSFGLLIFLFRYLKRRHYFPYRAIQAS